MLVLSRRLNQSVMIGDNIKITVIEVGNGRVRLGIEASKNVPVHRQEIYKLIKDKDKELKNVES